MTLETSARVARWIERELDRLQSREFVVTFFGGEPLLNLPVVYELAERLWGGDAGARRREDAQHHHQRAAADSKRSSIGWCRSG